MVKPIWKTRTFYVGLAAIVSAVAMVMVEGAKRLPEALSAFLGGVGLITLRRGMSKESY